MCARCPIPDKVAADASSWRDLRQRRDSVRIMRIGLFVTCLTDTMFPKTDATAGDGPRNFHLVRMDNGRTLRGITSEIDASLPFAGSFRAWWSRTRGTAA